MNLTGKTAIVTGAGRGLGRAYAEALGRAGAAVVVNDVDAAVAAEVVKTITGAGGRASEYVAPVGTTEVAEGLVEHARCTFGSVDALVTNAGVLRDKVLWKMTDEDFDTVINVHLRGTFTCVRAAVQAMKEAGTGGSIIAVGSPTGQRGQFGQSNYGAAKAGIVGMVRTWALECARAGIDVNAIVPVAATEMTKSIPDLAPHIEEYERTGAPFPATLRMGRGFGVPEDVAGLVVYLASDASKGISGLTIGVGGDKLSLYAQPREIGAVYREGGWDADGIAEVWPTAFKSWTTQAGQIGTEG